MNLKGLIYCRVSSTRQVREGSGLSSQEAKCRDFARNTLGIEVERVFNDEGISGGIFKRKSIQDLLKYIDSNKSNNYIVIFEDLNRLSRDIQVHNLLRNEFRKRGVELQCPNFQFEESPEGTFRENMSVSMSQYEKDKNRQRVMSRIESRLSQGYWCFPLPLGYTYTKDENGGKKVIKDESNWRIIKSAFEKYANDELKSINDVVKFFHNKGIKVGTIKNGKVYNSNLASRILKNILYTGYLEYPKWGIEKRKAKHEAIINEKTFQKIQKKLNKKIDIVQEKIIENENRLDKSEDFPLRGYLYCETSKNMFSGAWSQGKQKKFPYYTYSKNSPLHGKSINRNKLHTQFEDLLKNIQPKEDLIQAFEKAIEISIESREKDKEAYKKKLGKDIKNIDIKIGKYLNRISKTNSDIIIENYEKEVEKLEKEKTQILENFESDSKKVRTPIKRKIKMVRNALDIWKSSNLNNKKALIKNIFPEGIPINEKKQVGTPTFSLIYQSFSIGKSSINQMVDPSGIEPETYRLRGGCSTNGAKDPYTFIWK